MAKKILIENLPDYSYQRLLKQKEADGFKDKSWKEWLLSKAAPALQMTDAEGIRESTKGGLRQLWGRNIGHNIPIIRRKNMKSLRDIPEPEGESVIVVGGGPSVAMHNQLETLGDAIRSGRYKGQIVSCDRMLLPLLEKGIVPNFVLSVDGSEIILPFFKSKLFLQHKDEIKVLIHIAVHPKVVNYLHRHKAQVYWFLAHSIYASEEEVENSDAIVTICMTSTKEHPKGVQTLPCGGNVGTGSWAFAWVILHKKKVALIGFDMGYPEGTRLDKTYYYSTFLGMTRERLGRNMLAALTAEIPYEREYNPAWNSYTLTDQVFRSYREILEGFFDIAPKDVQTYSCVEGGALRHPKLKYMPLRQFLSENPS